MNLKRILFCLTAFAAAIATSVPCAAKRPSGSDLRLLYWNIQNGMWSGQDDNYDRFVEWVKEFDADVCVWCEAQSIYRSGTADRMPEADRYLVGNWGELAVRYGHKYWYVGGHRDNFPQVITSKYPIENVERIVGEEPDSVVTHGAGWARIVKNGRTVNIVTLHLWPQAYAYRATDVAASRDAHEGDRYRRMEIVYCTPVLYDCVTRAEVVRDDYTEPVRDPKKLSNFWHPSDHRPIVVDFDLKKAKKQ